MEWFYNLCRKVDVSQAQTYTHTHAYTSERKIVQLYVLSTEEER